MVLGLVELFLVLILVVPWLWVLYDALRWPGPAWKRAGRSKPVWIAFIVALAPFGVLAYLILTRPELVAASALSDGTGRSGGGAGTHEENPLLLMRRNTVVAIVLLLAAIAVAGVLGVLRMWQLA